MPRYAIVGEGGLVTNIVEWDGGADWSPPDGTTAVPLETDDVPAAPGGTFDGAVFTAPVAQTPPEATQEPTPDPDPLIGKLVAALRAHGSPELTAAIDADPELAKIVVTDGK